jgi:hypothetical protein
LALADFLAPQNFGLSVDPGIEAVEKRINKRRPSFRRESQSLPEDFTAVILHASW